MKSRRETPLVSSSVIIGAFVCMRVPPVGRETIAAVSFCNPSKFGHLFRKSGAHLLRRFRALDRLPGPLTQRNDGGWFDAHQEEVDEARQTVTKKRICGLHRAILTKSIHYKICACSGGEKNRRSQHRTCGRRPGRRPEPNRASVRARRTRRDQMTVRECRAGAAGVRRGGRRGPAAGSRLAGRSPRRSLTRGGARCAGPRSPRPSCPGCTRPGTPRRSR